MAKLLGADFAFCKGDRNEVNTLMAELAAHDAKDSWTWRESRYVDAWTTWMCQNEALGCYAILLEIVTRHPGDLFAVKRGQDIAVCLGDSAKVLEVVMKASDVICADTSPPPKYLHGMWSFGLVHVQSYDDAEAKALEGFAAKRDPGKDASITDPITQLPVLQNMDAWLDLALASSLYLQGEERLDDLLEHLLEKSVLWSIEAMHPSLYSNLWWHVALAHCERREFAESISIFDERLWTNAHALVRADPLCQSNALNLLWRLETRGRFDDTRPRWANVIAGCRDCHSTLGQIGSDGIASLQHSDLMLDVLLVRAFSSSAREEEAPLQSWLADVTAHAAQLATTANGTGGRADVYRALANIIAELYRSDQKEAGIAARHAKARKELKELQPKWSCLGGSEVQRGFLLEAMESHPVVCGQPEVNFDTLFLG
jgi:hypothetical protein